MYRKQLRMARGEGEAVRSHFVERVVKLPLVHSAWDYAANTYANLKEANRLVHFTLTNAERSVTFVAGQARPVVLRFEKQIQAVDELACKGLGTLEEKVPFITKPADEIIDGTRKLYASTVFSRIDSIRKYGNDKVKSVTDFGFQKASNILESRLVQSVMTSVDGALVVTENYIDHLLPPADEENDVRKQDKSGGLVRLSQLSSKIRHRAYRNLTLRLEYIQERSFELVLTYPIGMIEYSKEHVDAAVQYANMLWDAIKQEETDEKTVAERSLVEQQLLHLARLVTRQMARVYTTAATILPGTTAGATEADGAPPQQPQSAAVLSAVRERALWVLGILRVVPRLLPMYLYGFATWLEQIRGDSEPTPNEKTAPVSNGVGPTNHKQDSNHASNGRDHSQTQESSSGDEE